MQVTDDRLVDVVAPAAADDDFFQAEVFHGGDQRFERRVGADAGFFCGLSEQITQSSTAQAHGNRHAAEHDDVNLLLHQGVNTVPVVADGFFHGLGRVVVKSQSGDDFHHVRRHDAIKLVAQAALDFSRRARVDQTVAKARQQPLDIAVHCLIFLRSGAD